jgi:tetratricopeptide (TPR) repeat protein
VDSPEKIPLDEAVARDLIPCSVCGAKGAGVRPVGGRKHFLCGACAARGRRWTWAVVGAFLLAVGSGLYALRSSVSSRTPGGLRAESPISEAEYRTLLEDVVRLTREGKPTEVLRMLRPALARIPDDPVLNLYTARNLMPLSYYEASLPCWTLGMQVDPKVEPECRFELGFAYQRMAHSAAALPHLEKAFEGSPFEKERRIMLAECYLDLERYSEALKLLEGVPPSPALLRYRHRALSYQGRTAEARRIFEDLDPALANGSVMKVNRAMVLAAEAREGGDFEGARRILAEARSGLAPDSIEALKLKRSALAIDIESGDLTKLEAGVQELLGSPDRQVRGEVIWYRILGLLMENKKEEAVALARQSLREMDPQFAPLRQETLMLQYLSGRWKIEDLEKEAKAVNRFRANDLYYFMALATGDRVWAEKALSSTPGHNFPYHAIKRFLDRK